MLKITNSITKQKEVFVPMVPGQVKLYACGPTVYDEPHLGHLRSAFFFEVLRRFLESDLGGYQVTFVRNVTDVDDKIIDKARASGSADLNAETRSVSEKYLTLYRQALQKLGIRAPTIEPRATEHIPEMIRLIQGLVKTNGAYESGGDVYFDVGRFASYGKLSHQKKEEMLEHARVDKNEKKRDSLDFALWKRAKEGEPSWESPWGQGRPGWHIECSAMSMKYLGETFDIHGGGRDLIFPHHENEIAQSEALTGKPFARYWVHHGLITIRGQKMAKSLKNFITLADIEAKGFWGIEELKFLFLGTHYSMPLDYSEDKMKMERSIRERFYFFFEELQQLGAYKAKEDPAIQELKGAFKEALEDDINTPKAIAIMHGMVDKARRLKDPGSLLSAGHALKSMGSILGVFGPQWFSFDADDLSRWVGEKIDERRQARLTKEFAKADAIRAELAAKGVVLTDLADGKTIWRRA